VVVVEGDDDEDEHEYGYKKYPIGLNATVPSVTSSSNTTLLRK